MMSEDALKRCVCRIRNNASFIGLLLELRKDLTNVNL